jgi:dTDP-4-amino-4,6-dideoxygalactose transaminase
MRMEGFQGAVLNIKLKHLHKWTEARRKNAALYNELFKGVESVVTPKEMAYSKHVYHLYVIRVKDRQGLQNYLNEKGVASGYPYMYPLHLQKAYENLEYHKGDFPVTERVMEEIISLPMYPELTPMQIEYVVESVKEFVQR